MIDTITQVLKLAWDVLPFLIVYLIISFGIGCFGAYQGERFARKQVKAREKAVRRREQKVTLERFQLRADRDQLNVERLELRDGAQAALAKADYLTHAIENHDTVIQDWKISA